MRIKPSLVCIFEQPQDESVRRLSNRRLDPLTGEYFNIEVKAPKDDGQAKRLVPLKGDAEELVKKRFIEWNSHVSLLEESFKDCLLSVPSDRLIEQVRDQISEHIEHPIY